MPENEASEADVGKLLQDYPPEIQGLARKTRDEVRAIAQDAVEEVDWSAKMLGYNFGAPARSVGADVARPADDRAPRAGLRATASPNQANRKAGKARSRFFSADLASNPRGCRSAAGCSALVAS
jgi:hypothetical protein